LEKYPPGQLAGVLLYFTSGSEARGRKQFRLLSRRVTASPPDSRLVRNGLKRGETADPGSLNPGIPSRRHPWTAPAKGWLSHRERAPAQTADAREPQGTGEGAGLPRYGPVGTADTPGGAHRPQEVHQGNGERRTRQQPSVAQVPRRRRRQPEAAGAQDARRSKGLGEGPGEADVGPVFIRILRSGVRRKSHAPFCSSGRRSDLPIDCNRLNATFRERLASLTRRGRALARRTLTLQHGLSLIGTV